MYIHTYILIYPVLILVSFFLSCFPLCFFCYWCVQLNMGLGLSLSSNSNKRFETFCEGALSHRNTRESYSNNLKVVGPRGGVHNMLRVRVCAAHMGGFLGPKFSKQGSLFRQIFHKQGWVIQKLAKNSKKLVVFRQSSS